MVIQGNTTIKTGLHRTSHGTVVSWIMLETKTDYRRHAQIERAIRDLRYDVGLNHLPSDSRPDPASTGRAPRILRVRRPRITG